MAELTPRERLQPSLLDRLIDDHPNESSEGRDDRVLSLTRLREGVRRDLAWLLNTAALTPEELSDYPEVQHSVIGYGIPDLSGVTPSSLDIHGLEQALERAILEFEPRILKKKFRVKVLNRAGVADHNALSFEIEGELWSQPLPERLYVRTQLDLETGDVQFLDEKR